MDNSSFEVQVGVEELLFLLFTLGYRSLPGLGNDMMEGLNQDQIERALAAGYNSLRARGWVQPAEGGKVVVDSAIVALLFTCATADRLLFINRQPIDGPPEVRYVHFGTHLSVIHDLAGPGVHRFVGTAGQGETLIAQALHLGQQPMPAAQAIEIPPATLDILIQALNAGGIDAGVRALTNQGLPESSARTLAESVSAMRANTMVAMLSLDEQHREAPADGFSLLESDAGFWILETETHDSGDERLTIAPISSQLGFDKIKALIAA